MVLTASGRSVAADPILAAAAQSYTRRGCTVVETSLAAAAGIDGIPGPALLAADLGIAECPLADDVDPGALAPGIDRLAATGWEVTVLVPTRRMGEAHRALRGRQARLQPWWRDEDAAMCFGTPEVP